MTDTEMKAYEEQINLELLNDVINFVTMSTETTVAQREELWQRNIFPYQNLNYGSFQDKYGFLYLGELLERYGERFDLSKPSLRALALALAYTRNISNEKMFVDNQRADFIQSVKRNSGNDIYLTGALYLLSEGESDALIYEQLLIKWEYTKTEELIFVMSLFHDTELALAHFNTQLLQLLGTKRTLSVWKNTGIYKKMVLALLPLKRQLKAKNTALLRALMALPTTYVQEGNRPYSCLLEHGYTPLEIFYLNIMAVQNNWVSDGVRPFSLRAEKIIVSLFRTVLLQDTALPAESYDHLTRLYKSYEDFEIKCYEVYKLSDALKYGIKIKCPEIMTWFIQCESVRHPAVRSFDIMDPQWDTLPSSIGLDTYQQLFELSLDYKMSGAEIKDRIARYDTLIQGNYLDTFRAKRYNHYFSLMVEKSIINLWEEFQSSLPTVETPASSNMLYYIGGYIRRIETVEAFSFMKKFMSQYGYAGLKQFFPELRNGFEDQLWSGDLRSGNNVVIKIERDYLKDDPNGELLLLHWIDDYFFHEKPDHYLIFVQSVLQNSFVVNLLPFPEQRKLFDLLISQSKLSSYDARSLKERYFTPEEKAADQAAIEANERAEEQKRLAAKTGTIQEKYEKSVDCSFMSTYNFLNKFYYSDDLGIASQIANGGLNEQLQKKKYALNTDEAAYFLQVCTTLLKHGAIDWAGIQNYISKIKGVTEDDPICDTTS